MTEPEQAEDRASRLVRPADAVSETLREYAGRGILRAMEEEETETGLEFRFFWLGPRPYHLVFEGRDSDQSQRGADSSDSPDSPDSPASSSSTLTLMDFLPDLTPDSEIVSDLEDLVRRRVEGEMPEHRSVDPERASVELTWVDSAAGERPRLDLRLRIRGDHYEYAVRRLLALVNEIWIRLNDRHQRYMWEAFDAPME